MTSLTKMPNFDPTKAGTAPPMISPAGDKMARNTGSRDWRNTVINQSDAQSAFEESVENGMENDPGMKYEYDDFLEDAEHMAGRSFSLERTRLRS